MISGIGIDIEETERFKKVTSYFLKSIFTKREIDYCNGKKDSYIHFAGRFCAKESVIKAHPKKLLMRDIEILNDRLGKIKVYIKGEYKSNIFCSISHIRDKAISFVIMEK